MVFTQKFKTQNPRNSGHFSMSETGLGEREVTEHAVLSILNNTVPTSPQSSS